MAATVSFSRSFGGLNRRLLGRWLFLPLQYPKLDVFPGRINGDLGRAHSLDAEADLQVVTV
jgi:hypothetical protein